MSESNDPVLLTGNQLIELIRPVILAYTKHEDYTNQILEMVDQGARMRISYERLSPATMLAYVAAGLLGPALLSLLLEELISRLKFLLWRPDTKRRAFILQPFCFQIM